MKIVNCASLIALVAGGLAVAGPASAAPSELSLNPASVSATHDMLSPVALLGGDGFRGPLSNQQQQQQQQQTRPHVTADGAVYSAPISGFSV
jgi:hypothetical protein